MRKKFDGMLSTLSDNLNANSHATTTSMKQVVADLKRDMVKHIDTVVDKKVDDKMASVDAKIQVLTAEISSHNAEISKNNALIKGT